MVAFTPTYGLPYLEGTDPPCFGEDCDYLESVFCDFARIVETQLDENDATIGRTATSIPMAMVSFDNTTTPVEMNALSTVPFDTVVFDTDNMATPVIDPIFGPTFQLTPQRNGIYQIDFYLDTDERSGAGAANGRREQFNLIMGADRISSFAPMAVGFTFMVGNPTPVGFPRASTLYAFTDTQPVPRALSVQYQPPTLASLFLRRGKLAVYWHSDL